GVSFAAAWALTPAFGRWRAARAAIGPLLWILAVLTVRAIARWADPPALWEEATRRAPDAWEAHAGYAEALREAGRCGDAAREFDSARRVNPEPAESSPGQTVCR